jgi:HSP20 family protein
MHPTPWMGFETLKEKMDRLVEEWVEQTRAGRARHQGAYFWQPAVDVFDSNEAVVIHMELPGLPRDAITIETREAELLVYGERRHEKEIGGGAYQAMERSYGPFAREFVLPRDAVTANITAVLKDGLLTITIPKSRTPHVQKRIPIND